MLKNRGNFSGNARYEGFCIDLLKEIAHMVGFAYRIELVPDGKYGVYDYETGEWNGIVRQLMDKVSLSILEASTSAESIDPICILTPLQTSTANPSPTCPIGKRVTPLRKYAGRFS